MFSRFFWGPILNNQFVVLARVTFVDISCLLITYENFINRPWQRLWEFTVGSKKFWGLISINEFDKCRMMKVLAKKADCWWNPIEIRYVSVAFDVEDVGVMINLGGREEIWQVRVEFVRWLWLGCQPSRASRLWHRDK